MVNKSVSKQYENLSPRVGVLRFAKHALVNNWGIALFWIITLLLAAQFAREINAQGNEYFTVSEAITSIGLTQIVNTMVYSIFIAIGVASSTIYVRNLSKSKNSLSNVDKKKHIDKNRNNFGALIFVLLIFIILCAFLVAFVGKYLVYLQNLNLPENYRRIIIDTLYFYGAGVPLLAIYIILYNHLSADGNPWTNSVSGVIPVIVLVICSEALFHANAFRNLDSESRLASILGTSYIVAIFCNTFTLLVLRKILIVKGKSHFDVKISDLKHFSKDNVTELIKIGMPIFVRSLSVAISLILVNTLLQLVPVKQSWYVSTKGTATKLPNNAIYWQYITAATDPVLSFTLRGLFAVGGIGTRFLASYHLSQKNYKKTLDVLKWALIYSIIYLTIAEIFILGAAGPLSLLFGIKNNSEYHFLSSNGQDNVIKAFYLKNQCEIVFRISFGSLIFFAIQPILGSYCFAARKIKLSVFVFTLDKVIIELPMFALLAFASYKTNVWWLVWCAYIISDILTAIILLFIFRHYWRILKAKAMAKNNKNTTSKKPSFA